MSLGMTIRTSATFFVGVKKLRKTIDRSYLGRCHMESKVLSDDMIDGDNYANLEDSLA